MARPTNFKLDIRMEDHALHQPQAPWPPRSKVKVARSRQFRWSMDSTTACMGEGKGASFWTSSVNNRFSSESPDHKNSLFSEPPTVYRRERVAVYMLSVLRGSLQASVTKQEYS